MKKAAAKARGGRPPAGIDGKAVQDYRRLTLYLPPDTAAQLSAMRTLRGQPAWRIVREALDALLHDLEPEDRRAVENLARRAVAAERAA